MRPDPTRTLCTTLLSLLGVFGCSGQLERDDEGAGVTTDPSGGGVDGEGEGVDGTGGGVDMGSEGLPCDFNSDPPLSDLEQFPDCSIDPFLLQEGWAQLICVAAEPGADCAEVCGPTGICGDLSTCEGISLGNATDSCPPYYDAEYGMCCTFVVTGNTFGDGEEGRPFRPDEGPCRFADSHEGPAFAELAELPESIRARLASHWRRAALAEHASIASFARFVAQLFRFGAPPELIRDALAAAGDEVRHARDAFALASRYAGRSIVAGPLATHDALHGIDDLPRAVRAAVLEGCVAETLAAHEAALLAERARDPEVARILRGVAEDEARHAGLAWRFVAWALEQHPELRSEIAGVLREACDRVEQVRDRGPSSEVESLLAHGCAEASTRAAWRRRGLDRVVRPCAAALPAVYG